MKAIRRLLRIVPLLLGSLASLALLFVLLIRVEQTVEARGEVEVERYQVVRSQVGGRIHRVHVEPGQSVAAGDLLVELTDRDLEEEHTAVERRLAEAQAARRDRERQRSLLVAGVQPLETERQRSQIRHRRLEQSRQAAEVEELRLVVEELRNREQRMQRLAEEGLKSFEELEEARNATRQAEWRLRQTELEQERAQESRRFEERGLELLREEQRRRIAALDGEIEELSLEITRLEARLGEIRERFELHALSALHGGVVVSDPVEELLDRQVDGGEAILTVIDEEAIRFLAHVPEEQIVKVHPLQRVYVEIDGLPKRRFEIFLGQVDGVGPRPETGARSITYPVEIRLERPWAEVDGERFYLRDGMRGKVEIVYRGDVALIRALYDFLTGAPGA